VSAARGAAGSTAAAAANTVLSVQNLSKSYARLVAVDDVSFRIGRSEILGLLGPNGADLRGAQPACARRSAPRAVHLLGLSDTKCGLLSSGEQTRVALAKALLNAPDLLLLDEPTASLDPAAAQSVRRHIQSLAGQRDCGTFSTCSPRRCASPNTSPGSC